MTGAARVTHLPPRLVLTPRLKQSHGVWESWSSSLLGRCWPRRPRRVVNRPEQEMARGVKKFSQAERPQGRIGRIFGWLMGRLNRPAYRWTVEQLKAAQPKSYLEIGFGTGHLEKLIAQKLKPAKIAGVDPSPLMVETAQKRLRRFRKKMKIDLLEGDDTRLPKDGPYDAIAALHSFQFWTHPATTLAEIRSLLAPGGKFVMVLRLHGKRSKAPNPLSRNGDEVSAACKALQDAGFTIQAMRGISKSSHGIVAGIG